MSGAFVYTPTSEPQNLFYPHQPYQDPFSPGSYPQNSPFLPPSPYLFPGTPSPYANTVALPATPSQAVPNELAYDVSLGWGSPRSRRVSFAGDVPMFHGQQSMGGIGGQVDQHQQQQQQPFAYPTSIYNIYQPIPVPVPVSTPMHPAPQLHPWLDGNVARSDFWFDLSMAVFNPLRVVDMHGTRIPITLPELSAPATHPPTVGLKITSDALREWPMIIGDGTRAVTLGDVLRWVYHFVHKQIDHEDWARLGEGQQREVAKAYNRRCRALRGDYAAAEKAQGIKRVDYFMGKVLFKGMWLDSSAGVLRMLTA